MRGNAFIELWTDVAGRPPDDATLDNLIESPDASWMTVADRDMVLDVGKWLLERDDALDVTKWTSTCRWVIGELNNRRKQQERLMALGLPADLEKASGTADHVASGDLASVECDVDEWALLRDHAGVIRGAHTISIEPGGDAFRTWRCGWHRPEDRYYVDGRLRLVQATVETYRWHRGPGGGRVRLAWPFLECVLCGRPFLRVDSGAKPGTVPRCW